MNISQGAKFERPVPGMYLATLVDVVDLPQQQTQYGIKDRVRFHWVLAHLTGGLYLGKDGKPVEATLQLNANMGAKADLPKRLTQILGQAPPVITSTEQLESLVLGRSNIVVIVQSPNPKDPNDPYANVDGIGPIPPGMPAAPAIPQGYVRVKNRPKQQAGPQGQPVNTYATPQAAAAAAVATVPPPAAVSAAAPAPTPEQIAAYLASQRVSQPNPNTVNVGQPAATPDPTRPF